MVEKQNLEDWLIWLEQLHPFAIDMGLERLQAVAERLALPRPAPLVITVTGTNGKGSTCAFIAALLRTQGLCVGIYSSPHLLRYNERVDLNGCLATDDQLCAAFAAVEAARGETSLTYFEMGTLAAFWLFAQQRLDAVVLEVGLGGRLDAVNLVDADMALVTSVALDHSEWLGNDRESVGHEKAGIFRPGKPALCGDPEPPQSLKDFARTVGAPLWVRGETFGLRVLDERWSWWGVARNGQRLFLDDLPLLGLPMENSALALQAYALLGLPWQPQQLIQALLQVRIPGRLDRRSVLWQGVSRQLLLDVAHNPHASAYLAARLPRLPEGGKRHAVFGLLADKDLEGVIAPLLSEVDQWWTVSLPTVRSRSAKVLRETLEGKGGQARACDSVADALQSVCKQAGPEDEILVFGSFYCVADALDWLSTVAGIQDPGL